MVFDLGQAVVTLRIAHPIAISKDDKWASCTAQVPEATYGQVVGLKTDNTQVPSGVVVRFDKLADMELLMRPEDLELATPLYAKLAQGTEWLEQNNNILPQLWLTIQTLKSLGFPLQTRQQLEGYLKLHDNHYLQQAAATMSDDDFSLALSSNEPPSEDFLLEHGVGWNQNPVKMEEDRPAPVEAPPTEEEENEERILRLMGAGISLLEFVAQQGTGEDVQAAPAAPTSDPLMEFLLGMKNAGFYMGNLHELQEMSAASSHPGAQALQALSQDQYNQLWQSGQVDRAYDDKVQQYKQRRPGPAPAPEKPKMPAPMEAPEQAPVPGGMLKELNQYGQLIHNKKPVMIRDIRGGNSQLPVKPGAVVFVRDTKRTDKRNWGVGQVQGLTSDGELVVHLQEQNKDVAVKPMDAQIDKYASVVSMRQFMAQMAPPVPTDTTDAAPPGSKTDYTGQPMNPGDYVQPAPGTPDQMMPNSQGVITEVKQDGSIIYTDDQNMQRAKDPGTQLQVIRQG